MGLGAVALAVAVLGFAAWMAYLVTQSRVRHRREAAPQNLSPYLTDDELENNRLNRILVAALISTAVIAIVMPIYYLNESDRQAQAADHFDEQAIERGLEWFTEYKCGNCHGADGGGGGARFVEGRSGITTTWAAPSLNDVLYRYTQVSGAGAQLSVQGVPHVAAVLVEERVVQAALLADARHNLRIVVLPLQGLDGIAGTESAQRKGGQRDRQQHEGRPEEAPHYVGEDARHRSGLPGLYFSMCT